MSEPGGEQRVGTRRGFFALAGAAVAGLFAGRFTSHDANAADGNSVTAGQTTLASAKTELSTSGAITNDGAFVVDAPNADYGVMATGSSIGVYGKGPIGVLGDGAVGGVFSGTDTAISLTPTATSGPSKSQSLKGDVLVDADGVMWFCIADGTPGTWIKLSHGGYRPLSTPVRAYDSRYGGGKLTGGSPVGAAQTVGVLVPGVDPNAVSVVGNLTTTDQSAAGFATIWPAGGWPGTSNINFVAGVDIANSFTVALSSGTVQVAASVPTHFVIDIAGYIL